MAHYQSVAGAGATGIQIDGNNNTVTIVTGAAKLTLGQRHKLRGEPSNERELLLTELRATNLVGRENDLATLQTWLTAPRPISVRCLTAEAGVGKTRLAIDLCERAEALGWATGFARHEELRRFIDAENFSDWHWTQPTLIVVDYAAASTRVLRIWLEVLARRVPNEHDPPLRLLLLERHADHQVGWWADLTRPGGLSGRGPDVLFNPPEPVRLSSLREVEDRRELLTQTMAKAAKISGLKYELSPVATNPEFESLLADNTINREPLYLIMAGLVAATTGAPTALSLSQTDLAQRVAESERARLVRLAQSWMLDSNLICHLVACITLEGGCDIDAAKRLIEDEQRAMGYAVTLPVTDLVTKIADALPTIESGTGIDAVRPNMIAGAFLIREIGRERRPLTDQFQIVERAWNRAGIRVVGTIIRTIQDHAKDDAHPSLAWLDHLINSITDLEDLITFADKIPWQTVVLRTRGAKLQESIVTRLNSTAKIERDLWTRLALALRNIGAKIGWVTSQRKRVQPDPRPIRARHFNNLAARLSAVCRYEEALAAAETSVALYREIAYDLSDAFPVGLPVALNTLAALLCHVHRFDEALLVAQESVVLYQTIAAHRPLLSEEHDGTVAIALLNLSVILRSLGRNEEAVAAAQEAITVYRKLFAKRPDFFRLTLAAALYDVVGVLSNLGRHIEALAAAEESLVLHRELVARHDLYRPGLAAALESVGSGLNALGRFGEALQFTHGSVDLYRQLETQQHPDFRQSSLALALQTFAIALSSLGRCGDALAPARESVALHRKLAAHQHPDASPTALAGALRTLAVVLSALGRSDDALEATRESVALERGFPMADGRPYANP